jgi:protein-S-isoprenylcysteine O-methyltransferase Ste14
MFHLSMILCDKDILVLETMHLLQLQQPPFQDFSSKMRVSPMTSPNRIPWPPILAAGFLLAGLLSRVFIPDVRLGLLQMAAGVALMLAGGAMIVAAFMAFIRHRSNILPHRPADLLITTGIFRFSRNPIYTGEIIAILGLGIALGAVGLVVAAIVLALAVRQMGVLREERHLAARFGEEWERYRTTTRRWL